MSGGVCLLLRMAGESRGGSVWDAEIIQPVGGIGSPLVQHRCAIGKLMKGIFFYGVSIIKSNRSGSFRLNLRLICALTAPDPILVG